MKNYLCLVFLLVQLSSSVKSYEHRGSDNDSIRRPCPTLDIHCVRAFFLRYAYCVANSGPIPDPLYLQKYNFYLPHTNVTAELNDVTVQGLLNAKIVEFYDNRKTNKVVLAIQTLNLTINTPRLVLKYQRKALEPIELIDKLFIAYGSVTLTITIPFINTLELDEAEVTVYAENGNPPYTIGVNLNNSQDPLVKISFGNLLKDTKYSVRESFVTQGPRFMQEFIQHNICDMRSRPNRYYHPY